MLGSSHQWILNGPENASALAIVDSGLYDCWFLNLRGNRVSRRHATLDADHDPEFWDFTFQEFGKYDITAAIQMIQKR